MKKILTCVMALFLISSCAEKDLDDGELIDGMRADGTIIPGTQADLHYNVGDTVYFEFNSSSVNDESKDLLKRQLEWINNNDKSVIIEGHCDERGTREYNIGLGERRANAVKNQLISLGLPSHRIDTVSYGKERPAVVGTGEEIWAQNRRAVTVILK
jgi:peptidoglycan-associated lipoprotein